MLKGSRTSLSDGGDPANEKPRKKLSFREPEVVMGAVQKENRRKDDDRRSEKKEDSVRRKISGEFDRRREPPPEDPVRRKISADMERRREPPSEDSVRRKTNAESDRRSEPPPDDSVRRKSGRETPEESVKRKCERFTPERKEPTEELTRRRSERGATDTERRRIERGLTADKEWMHRRISEEDEEELESQAMKIVRTVGQAFEVCHKLSINSPGPLDDDQDPLQDLEASSDKDSEGYSDHPRKGDGMSDTVPGEDSDLNLETPPPANRRHLHLDMIPPPISSKGLSASSDIGETISSPLLEPLKDTFEGLPSEGTPLSAHHEIQLLREQLEQQCQQTHAALAQVHLLRDQLAAETTARIEAQARTHQLLIHNKELLDHITALVSHLQEQERTLKPESNVTVMPQVYADMGDHQDGDSYVANDNRNSGAFVTAPSSPKARHAPFYAPQQPMQSMGSLYPLGYPTAEQHFQAQLIQRLQGLAAGYPPILSPPVYPTLPSYNICSYPSSFPYPKPRREEDARDRMEDPPPRLDPPPSRRPKRESPSPRAATSPAPVFKQSTSPLTVPVLKTPSASPLPIPAPKSPKSPSPLGSPTSPPPIHSPKSTYQHAFASALSTFKTLRVAGSDKGKKVVESGPGPITRSTSEKVPNRSELMDLVQRTTWARQTK